MKVRNVAVGITLITAAAAAPIIPQDMKLLYTYQQTCEQALHPDPIPAGKEYMYDPQYIPASCTGEYIYVSVFKDSNDNFVFKEIPRATYELMGRVEGQKDNPNTQEFRSLLDLSIQQAKAAIAYDNSTINTFPGGSVASITYSFTPGASATYMQACSYQDQSFQTDNSSTATFNGTAMTKVTGQTGSGLGFTGGMGAFYQISPTSGAHNVVINYSPNTRAAGTAESVTGSPTTGQPDAFNSSAPTSATLTQSVTVVHPNSFLILCAINDTGSTLSGGTGTTVRQSGGSGHSISDSNGGVAVGSQSLILSTAPASNRWTAIIVSVSSGQSAASFAPWQFWEL